MLTSDEQKNVTNEISATYEVLGQSVTPAALKFMVGDLSEYSADQIGQALGKCRRECKGRFSLPEIISRMESTDGRLAANEAWALACSLQDESASGATTNEILEALSVSSDCSDQVAARMAFISAYDRIITEAREEGAPVKWFMSFGHDKAGRAPAIEKALIAGRISQDRAQQLLPDHSFEPETMQRTLGGPRKVLT